MNQTQALRMARISSAARNCPACATYAWAEFMQPVASPFRGGGWHHPACPRVTDRRAMAPQGFVRATGLATGATVPTVPTIVSSEVVMDAAKTFDSDLANFVNETNANPNFGKRGYLRAPPDQKATHEAFSTALSSLMYDWWGESMGDDEVWRSAIATGRKGAGPLWSGTDNDVLEAVFKPEELGFYKRLQIRMAKTFSSIGSAEMTGILSFRDRLKQIMATYKSLGYNLLTKISPDPKVPTSWLDDALTALKWTAGAAIVGGGVYLAVRFIPRRPTEPIPATMVSGAAP